MSQSLIILTIRIFKANSAQSFSNHEHFLDKQVGPEEKDEKGSQKRKERFQVYQR